MKPPFHLFDWIKENKHLLQPPIGNKNLYVESQDYVIMIVGGPNSRTDFHYNETEELFYQLQGDIELHLQIENKREIVSIKEGEMYLLPAKIPHSPSRKADTVGLVIERKRANSGGKDGLLWFCNNCNHLLHEVYFGLENIEKDFIKHFNFYNENKELHVCKNCGTKN
jgi:3-hydroxyanthranilate 3,4-dioxygenase